jgi:hypothetical protein
MPGLLYEIRREFIAAPDIQYKSTLCSSTFGCVNTFALQNQPRSYFVQKVMNHDFDVPGPFILAESRTLPDESSGFR